MKHSFFAGALLAAAIAPAFAQVPTGSSRDKLVVSPQWLAQHLHDRDLVMLQVGDQATYNMGHIPGARFGDWMKLHTMNAKPGDLSLEMPPAAELHAAL